MWHQSQDLRSGCFIKVAWGPKAAQHTVAAWREADLVGQDSHADDAGAGLEVDCEEAPAFAAHWPEQLGAVPGHLAV